MKKKILSLAFGYNVFARAGGIRGTSGSLTTTNNCYNTGEVSATSSSTSSSSATTGGIVGTGFGSGIFSNCYWNTDSIQTRNGNVIVPSEVPSWWFDGTPLTTAEMKLASNFLGFDFDTVWDIKSGVNDGYPIFCGTGFGDVPNTGVADITTAMIAMFAFLAIAAGLWIYVIRRRLIESRNG